MNIPDGLQSQVKDYVSEAQQTVIGHGNTRRNVRLRPGL